MSKRYTLQGAAEHPRERNATKQRLADLEDQLKRLQLQSRQNGGKNAKPNVEVNVQVNMHQATGTTLPKSSKHQPTNNQSYGQTQSKPSTPGYSSNSQSQNQGQQKYSNKHHGPKSYHQDAKPFNQGQQSFNPSHKPSVSGQKSFVSGQKSYNQDNNSKQNCRGPKQHNHNFKTAPKQENSGSKNTINSNSDGLNNKKKIVIVKTEIKKIIIKK